MQFYYHLVSSGIIWYHLVSSGIIWYQLASNWEQGSIIFEGIDVIQYIIMCRFHT